MSRFRAGLCAGVVAMAVGVMPGGAQAASLKVTSTAIGCCVASTADGVAWSVRRDVGASAPTFTDLVVKKQTDANSFLFLRAAATGAAINSVSYTTALLTYCAAGGKLVSLEQQLDGTEKLTFSGFTRFWTSVSGVSKFGWDLVGQKQATAPVCETK